MTGSLLQGLFVKYMLLLKFRKHLLLWRFVKSSFSQYDLNNLAKEALLRLRLIQEYLYEVPSKPEWDRSRKQYSPAHQWKLA